VFALISSGTITIKQMVQLKVIKEAKEERKAEACK